jgi:D-beta-D-heptose 7-phosphate kinase/D-beta-D-heptose 1-phosphate adenosyltransferase
MTYDLEHYAEAFAGVRVLCLGDVMLDRYVYGAVERVSPEAPVQVLAVEREEAAAGGCANVAVNLAGLGAHCVLLGLIGEDTAGQALSELLIAEGERIDVRLVRQPGRPTTTKVRFVSERYSTHLLRVDWEDARPVDDVRAQLLLTQARRALGDCHALVLSDYGKGVLAADLTGQVIDAARAARKPIVVDPKGNDYGIYRGATVICPNRAELTDVLHRSLRTLDDVADAAIELAARCEGSTILVTCGEEGMMLAAGGARPIHIPAHPTIVRDVSGAGDTVVAVVAAMMAAGVDVETAARVANAAASVVVGKRGTASLGVAELKARLDRPAFLHQAEKIVHDRMELNRHLAAWREQGFRIGFTNGCFDLLHPGHVRILTAAREACDRLVVGLNSDASARRLKGAGRPIQDERGRAEVLAALAAVDLVVPFEEDTPLELIRRVRPNVLVKGADYRIDEVVGRDIVEADGGKVVLVDLVSDRSTTRLVERAAPAAKAVG